MSKADRVERGRDVSSKSISEWTADEAITFSGDDFDAAVDRMMSCLDREVSVLGLGEPLHGGDAFLTFRNRLFRRLVEVHGYSAITLETNDLDARLVDDYVRGRGPTTYEAIADAGFSYGSGHYTGNRELVEWMRQYNASSAHPVKLNFYGTLPSRQETTESPRSAVELALAYLATVDADAGGRHRSIIEPLLGSDAEWEDAAAIVHQEIIARVLGSDNTSSADVVADIGTSPRADALRLAVQTLAFDLRMRRPELTAKSDREAFQAALHHLDVAGNLLALHAALARRESLDTLVSMRDAMAAEHVAYIAGREHERGKVLVYLHGAHLRRTKTKLLWYEFWPTGAHLDQLLRTRFAVIGGALGTSEANFIGEPESGSIEAHLLARKSESFLPVEHASRLAVDDIARERSGSGRPYVPYSPLTRQSLRDIDVLAFLQTSAYTRGAPPLPS